MCVNIKKQKWPDKSEKWPRIMLNECNNINRESEKEEERLKLVDNLLHYQIHRFIFKKARPSFHSHVWHSPLGPLQASKEKIFPQPNFQQFFLCCFCFPFMCVN